LSQSNADAERADLRTELRAARRRLEPRRRRAAERAIANRIQRLAAFRSARSVAIYFAFDGEPGLNEVISAAQRAGKMLAAPLLRERRLTFVRLPNKLRLTRNRLGIEEPVSDQSVDPRRLDLVLTPLVAFDASGVRLGVGGGYYDRCFHYLTARRVLQRPKLVGVGFDFQRLPHIERQAWDVPLWGAVTDVAAYRFR
jgi:5-formyltetrahydrofolate cyclo-ligase